MIAQANVEGITLMTADSAVAQHRVALGWLSYGVVGSAGRAAACFATSASAGFLESFSMVKIKIEVRLIKKIKVMT